jgi:hypothetical protein
MHSASKDGYLHGLALLLVATFMSDYNVLRDSRHRFCYATTEKEKK